MKNKLPDLQNHIFEMIEKLNDDSLVGEDLNREIKRALAVNELARTAVQNGVLMVKAAEVLYGLPVSKDLPLIPPSPEENPVFFDKKKHKWVKIPSKGEV